MSAAKERPGRPAARAGASVPANTTMDRQHDEDGSAERTGGVFTLQREESPEVKSFPETGLVKSLGAFEPLPTAAPLTWGSENA